jgi:hypothetical protein
MTNLLDKCSYRRADDEGDEEDEEQEEEEEEEEEEEVEEEEEEIQSRSSAAFSTSPLPALRSTSSNGFRSLRSSIPVPIMVWNSWPCTPAPSARMFRADAFSIRK